MIWHITFIEKPAKQFPKRKNGLPGQMVSPTKVCLYVFFSLGSSYRFRLRKSWKNPRIDRVVEKTVKTQNVAPSARARARTDSDQLGWTSKSCWPIFMYIFFLSDQNWASYSLRREICVSFESSFLIFILGHLVNWILTNFFCGQENITILHWNNATFRDESLKNQQLVDVK